MASAIALATEWASPLNRKLPIELDIIGTAIAAMTVVMPTTIKSSMSEYPRWSLVKVLMSDTDE
ncbi:MAG TPA: hypothetical protein VGP77_15765 [Vicinamibacterales bacterium]|nr:hypothetical protein [Vicinamibacterales bacterium]